MRVKVWVEVANEVEVEVSAADFIAALAELPSADLVPITMSAINVAFGVLKRVPAGTIAQMTDTQREIISGALLNQANRYTTRVT